MAEYNPDTHIAVPKEELVKFEEARVGLYDWLTEQGFFGEVLSYQDTVRLADLCKLTTQIWNVANRTNWSK